jgi:alkyldihydroxyacetonephosphate synthase
MTLATSLLSRLSPAAVEPAPAIDRGDTRFVPPRRDDSPDDAENLRGWGFADSRFEISPRGHVVLTGKRYGISGVELPDLLPWMARTMGVPMRADDVHVPNERTAVPPPRPTDGFRAAIRPHLGDDQITDDDALRLRHGHGHTQEEIYKVLYGTLPRVPDLVVYPTDDDQVAVLVRAALAHGVVLIPYGGGTNVTDALRCPPDEQRPIVSVDMRRMAQVLWIDPVNRMARVQAGATGRVIADELARYGWTMGHEPDSVELSTLGGWIATNASGMKKNRYGNIEDLVIDLTVVTAAGTVEHRQPAPRASIGADPRQWIFGSEGALGIVTSAVVKLFPLPEVQEYGSVLFPDFERGFAFLYELSRGGVVPASVRLMDNTQFHFGQALKPAAEGMDLAKRKIQSLYVNRVRGFDPNKLVAATLVYEGGREEVEHQKRVVARIAAKHGGMDAGGENGSKGYQLTFGIAYIRDLIFRHWLIAESFETSVPWSRALELVQRVQQRAELEHKKRGLPGRPFFTGRITQVYETGVCCYFYYGFFHKGIDDPTRTYLDMEEAVREEILAAGGSLSHHHGVGKLRQKFLARIQSPAALDCVARMKKALDPTDVFGAGNQGLHAAMKGGAA